MLHVVFKTSFVCLGACTVDDVIVLYGITTGSFDVPMLPLKDKRPAQPLFLNTY